MNGKSAANRRVVFSIAILLLFAPLSSGCVLLLLGGGAAGGYAAGKDSIEGAVDGRKDRVYRSALQVAENKGLVKAQNPERGVIETLVNDVTVKIQVDQITDKAVSLKVSARKNLMPQLKTAEGIYTDILKKVS